MSRAAIGEPAVYHDGRNRVNAKGLGAAGDLWVLYVLNLELAGWTGDSICHRDRLLAYCASRAEHLNLACRTHGYCLLIYFP